MRKVLLISIPLLVLFMTSCHEKEKQVNIGSLTLGQNSADVIKSVKSNGCDFEWRENDTYAEITGKLNLFGVEWDNTTCEFDDGKLVSVTALCPCDDISTRDIEHIKRQMINLCGSGYNGESENFIQASYGIEGDNNGCIGGMAISKHLDYFHVTICLAEHMHSLKNESH